MLIILQDKYLQLIKQGQKTVEGRINTVKYTSLKADDIVTLRSDCDQIEVRITGLEHYNSFKDMIESVGLDTLLPNVRSVEEGVRLYHSFPGYAEREKLYGCLAIGIEVIPSGKSSI